MRRPETVEHLYLDFDGFFASVEQQKRPALRGRPVGIVPFAGTDRTCIIACSKEAKAAGCSNIMTVADARKRCPDIVLVPQSPDFYRRAHNALLAEIESVIPIEAVKSIDELACRLLPSDSNDPEALGHKIKRTLAEGIGPYVTCSIGFAANRQLAKIAGKTNKPDGITIWRPQDMPAPLFAVPMDDIPGIGSRMRARLWKARIFKTEDLYRTQPKQMRKLWHNVTGERLWYALHGYDIVAPQSERGMFGHGRVLPPDARTLPKAKEIARLLLIKAARRLRRSGYYCAGIWVWLAIRDGTWSAKRTLPIVHDDQAVLDGLYHLWHEAERAFPRGVTIFRVGVTLFDLSKDNTRQLDFLLNDDRDRRKWERINSAIDRLNRKYGKTVASLGAWNPPEGGHVGGKISYTRIPSAEDFW